MTLEKGDEGMIENFNTSNELKFKELTPEEKEARGILGRLYGPIASVVRATRNGRKYTQALWEKVFDNPITKEMFAQGGIPGELDHPTDRDETCSEKIAIMMPEPPTKNSDGQLIGYFDIIDTPCGRIAHALAKYGFHLGISSRGTGETYEDYDGNEVVDEDTYSFNAFDLVLLPACKDARLTLAESFDVKKKQFKEAIEKEIANTDDSSKQIILETLDNLNLDGVSTFENENVEDETSNNSLKEDVAVNDGTEALISELQEALMQNKVLQNQIITLQESLSVSYAKEMKLSEKVNKLGIKNNALVESVKVVENVKSQVADLNKQLNEKSQSLNEAYSKISSYKDTIENLRKASQTLKESYNLKEKEVSRLKSKVLALSHQIESLKESFDNERASLSEQVSELKSDSEINYKRYSDKLASSNQLVEKYKKVASQTIDKYIACKAQLLGVSVNDIKSRLSESYSLSDIDTICESLQTYKRNISKLPFNYSIENVSSMRLKEDKKVSKEQINPDDIIDKSLLEQIK